MKYYTSKILFSGLLLIAICSLVGLLSKFHWFFDLFNHFRPQALFASILLLLFAAALKNKKCILFAVLIISLNAGLIFQRLYEFPAAPQPHLVSYASGNVKGFSVIFSNVLTSNPNHQQLLDIISEYKPDIFVATEADERWTKALEVLKADYPFSLIAPRSDNFGMAVYSKIPFTGKKLNVSDYSLPLVIADFEIFELVAAHPIPPTSHQNTQELKVYTKEIAEIVSNIKKPLVLLGDFNATLWSDTVKDLRGLKLKRTNTWGFAWTWPSGFFPLAVQIDHIFVRDAVTADFRVLSDIGSDHFPVTSNIVIPASNNK